MATKRKTLPKEMDGLLEAGDLDALKKAFAGCEPNALYSKFGSNIFSRTPLPRAFALWAKEQGADVNFADHYGRTPIFEQAGSWRGDVQLLIDLGAEVNIAAGGMTPLHNAAIYGRVRAAKALLDAGAQVDARPDDPLTGRGMTPLEMALVQNRLPLAAQLEVCTLLLDHGAAITEAAGKAVETIGENFQRVKGNIRDPEFLARQTQSLQKLYELFGVAPAAEVEVPVHDGVSPIVIGEKGFAAQYNKLWDYLVPPSGRARTAQGEAIRIVGRVSHEILDNGGINWDGDFRRMLRALPGYFRLGDPLPQDDIAQAERIIRALRNGGGGEKELRTLCEYAVAWVLQNPEVLPPLPADYQR